MPVLTLNNLHKSFGETHALAGVSFEVAESEIVAVLGPSGCGKSTLLSLVAGLETPDEGEIAWDGVPLARVPPYQRGFGLMFQDYALFPHRNVYENVAFGLKMARVPKKQTERRVEEVLELVGLPGFAWRDVNTLSGGEAQRVALARSLAPRPRLLMLDEPLGSLDRTLRERLVFDLKDILRHSRQTALYVTHDQEEAFILANRVVVLNAGRVEQTGAPQEIYHQPASLFVARFLGLSNLLEGEVIQTPTGRVVRTPIGEFPAQGEFQGPVTALLRPDAARLDGGAYSITGRVMETSFRGSQCRAMISVNGLKLAFDFPSNARLPSNGETARLSFDPAEAIQILKSIEG